MAYQKVGTPRFYIDQIQYLKSIGFDFEKFYTDNDYGEPLDGMTVYDDYSIFSLSPEIQKEFTHPNNTSDFFYWDLPKAHSFDFITNNDNANIFVAFLNHNLGDEQSRFLVEWKSYLNNNSTGTTKNQILNLGTDLHWCHAQNGVTIIDIPESGEDYELFRVGVGHLDNNGLANHINIGALSWGVYYDMPHSPELDITMEIEFDGFDTIKTLGGATMTNVRYAGSPWWYDVDGNKVEPWAVGDSSAITKRNGRRTWTMKFSYLDQKDLLSSNYMSNHYMENNSGYDSDDLSSNENDEQQFYFNIDNDDSFVSQVLNKVGNGQRFIFQPDNTANNPSDFAIAMLDQDSLQIKQVANGVYDISLKITEVW